MRPCQARISESSLNRFQSGTPRSGLLFSGELTGKLMRSLMGHLIFRFTFLGRSRGVKIVAQSGSRGRAVTILERYPSSLRVSSWTRQTARLSAELSIPVPRFRCGRVGIARGASTASGVWTCQRERIARQRGNSGRHNRPPNRSRRATSPAVRPTSSPGLMMELSKDW